MRLPLNFADLAALAVLATAPTWARACWEEAAQRYGISADLLYAVARVESNLNPQAVNRSHLQRTGSYDIGLMQINSGHLSALARHGIGKPISSSHAPTSRSAPGCCPTYSPGRARRGIRSVPTMPPARSSRVKPAPKPAPNTPGGCIASCPRNIATNLPV
jgi:hypothetical protein